MNKTVINENVLNLFDKAEAIYEKFCEKAKQHILKNLNDLSNFRFMYKISDNTKEDKSLAITIKKLPKNESSLTRGISASTTFHEFIELYYVSLSELYNYTTKEFPFVEQFRSTFIHEYSHIIHLRNNDQKKTTIFNSPSKRQQKRNKWLGHTKDELRSYYNPTEVTAYLNDYLSVFYSHIKNNIHNIPINNAEEYLQSEFDKFVDKSVDFARELVNSKPKYIKSFIRKLAKRIQEMKVSQAKPIQENSEETWQDKFDNFLITEQELSNIFQHNSKTILELIYKEGTNIPYQFEYLDSNFIKNIPILHKVSIKQYIGHGASAIIFELENGMILKISLEREQGRPLVPIYKNIQDMLHSGEATKDIPMIYDVEYIGTAEHKGEYFDSEGELVEEPDPSSRFFYILMQKYNAFSVDYKIPYKEDYQDEEQYYKDREKYDKKWKRRTQFENELLTLYNFVEKYFIKLYHEHSVENENFDISKIVTIEKAHKDIMEQLNKDKQLYRILNTKKILPNDIKRLSNIVRTMVTSYIKKLPTSDIHSGNFGTTYNDPDTFVQFDY